MKSNEGRLQTGEHILAKLIENRIADAKVTIAKFEDVGGSVDMTTQTDLRELNLDEIQEEVNKIIKKELPVYKLVKQRRDIEDEFDLSKIPDSVQEIRIVEIKGFDKRPCRDPHVDNTNKIGCFKILKLERAGKDRYRFSFKLE